MTPAQLAKLAADLATAESRLTPKSSPAHWYRHDRAAVLRRRARELAARRPGFRQGSLFA